MCEFVEKISDMVVSKKKGLRGYFFLVLDKMVQEHHPQREARGEFASTLESRHLIKLARKLRRSSLVAWLWIVLGLLAVVGSITWILPSPMERRQGERRMAALKLGMKVRILSVDKWVKERLDVVQLLAELRLFDDELSLALSEVRHLNFDRDAEQLLLEAGFGHREVGERDLHLHLGRVVRIGHLRCEEEVELVVVRDGVVAQLHHVLAALLEDLLQQDRLEGGMKVFSQGSCQGRRSLSFLREALATGTQVGALV